MKYYVIEIQTNADTSGNLVFRGREVPSGCRRCREKRGAGAYCRDDDPRGCVC